MARSFRGLAGEVVIRFMSPWTICTAIGMGITFTALALLFGFLMGEAAKLALMIASILLFSRMALGAARGDLSAGLFCLKADRGERWRFFLIYFGLTIGWMIPFLGVAWVFQKIGTPDGMSSAGMLGGLFSVGYQALVSIPLLCVLVTAPTITGLLTTALVNGTVDDLREGYDLLRHRRYDLLTFFSNAIGGTIVFLGIYSIPFIMLCRFIGEISVEAAVVAAALSVAIPGAAAFILVARLTGAFISTGWDSEDPGSHAEGISGEGNRFIAFSAPVKAAKAPPEKLGAILRADEMPKAADESEIAARVAAIREQAASDLAGAVIAAEGLLEKHPKNAKVAFDLLRLYLQSKRADEVAALFPAIIDMQCSAELEGLLVKFIAATPEALRGKMFFHERQLKKLEQLCLKQLRYMEAWWCVMKLKDLGKDDPMEIERRSFEIADLAASKGENAVATTLYELFLVVYPNSGFVDYVKRCLENVRAENRTSV